MRPHTRPLRIIVDEATVDDGPAVRLLAALSARPGVHIYGTSPVAETRIEIGAVDVRRDLFSILYVTGERTRQAPVYAAASWHQHALELADEQSSSVETAQRALVLAQAAATHGIDCLVTNSPVLASERWSGHWRKAKIASPETACGLLGLYLRAHRDFTVWREGTTSLYLADRDYYRAAATASLPMFAERLEQAVAVWRRDEDSEQFELLRSVEGRLAQALRLRDYFRVRVRYVRPEETWDEAMSFFEGTILFLSGALDAAARYLDSVLGLKTRKRVIGWRSQGWKKAVALAAPSFSDLLEADASVISANTLVAALRNTIHGEVLSQERQGFAERPETTDFGAGVVLLDGSDGEEVIRAAGTFGADTEWGLKRDALEPDVVLVRPVLYVEGVVSAVLRGLSDLMGRLDRSAPAWTPFEADFWLPGRKYAEHLLLLTGTR